MGRRWPSVGRVDITPWEQRNNGASGAAPAPKTPAPKRRELSAPSPVPRDEPQQPVTFPREPTTMQWPPTKPEDSQRVPTPEPPPRKTYPANTVSLGAGAAAPTPLNPTSIQILSERADEAKEQSVEEWVRQTSRQRHHETSESSELEKFALDVAETVVSTMEKDMAQVRRQTTNTLSCPKFWLEGFLSLSHKSWLLLIWLKLLLSNL